MPTTYRIDSTNHYVYVTASGPLDKQQLLEAFSGFLNDPGFTPGMDLLADLRKAEIRIGLEAITELIETAAQHREQRGANYRIALVVTHGFQETMAQIFRIYSRAQPYTPAIFHALSDAQAWLGDTTSTAPPPTRGLSSPRRG